MRKIYPVILAGGYGTRMWPVSRRAKPKQFQKIISERSMLSETIRRVDGSKDHDRWAPPLIVCSEGHAAEVSRICENDGHEITAIIAEPVGRNTAAAIALAAEYLEQIEPDNLLVVLPADHFVKDEVEFRAYLNKACVAAEGGKIATLGINPTHPETGYGYIHSGVRLGEQTFEIEAFVEKPSLERAIDYIQNGFYYWNAGIFVASSSVIISEFQAHLPQLYSDIRLAHKGARFADNTLYLAENEYAQCEAISFDYAIMEKTRNAMVVAPVDVGWSDIGSWKAVYDHLNNQKTDDGCFVEGAATALESKNCFIRSDGPFVAAIGVTGLTIVATEDAIIVTEHDKAQRVKDLVDLLPSIEREDLL